MKRVFLVKLIFFITLAASCTLLNDDDSESEINNAIYGVIYLNEILENGSPKQGLIAINQENPNDFKILESKESYYEYIRVSPSKKLLIFGDEYSTGGAPLLKLYDLEKRKSQVLHKDNGDWLIGPEGFGVVWDKSNNGFYFTNPKIPFSSFQQVLYYNLKDSSTTTIRSVSDKIIYPIGLKGNDSLIVFSNEFSETDSVRYYFMDRQGEYQEKIKNHFLKQLNEEGIIKKGPMNLAWNDSLNLFTASYIDEEKYSGYKIIVTDSKGEIFEEFTTGEKLNKFPRWTRDGKIIFSEYESGSNVDQNISAKLLDPVSAEITDFFSDREFSKIKGIDHLDQ